MILASVCTCFVVENMSMPGGEELQKEVLTCAIDGMRQRHIYRNRAFWKPTQS
ncbi:hypothetical protein MtrunA17_Chr7g0272951 [Medicago truncatula]|uniref:Uncharacterized protein n=1 Tax=Medicago truncatula TaxID=3880 RepID=A0A396H9D8_MEDTR|nr:hypothetical protein MtrunA17_Chr7g0272951 [Medicago truncatula]